MPSRDELIALAAQNSLRNAQQEAQAHSEGYQKAIEAGDAETASFHQDQYYEVAARVAAMANTAAQQRQRPQQPQLTEKQQQILESYPSIRNDPRKWQEAQYWDASLRMRGYDPNSDAYAHAMLVGLGVLDANGTQEGNEVASADTMVEAVRGSKYAKDFTREQYDALANYRDELKKAGFLRMDENQ